MIIIDLIFSQLDNSAGAAHTLYLLTYSDVEQSKDSNL